MSFDVRTVQKAEESTSRNASQGDSTRDLAAAEAVLLDLASVFFASTAENRDSEHPYAASERWSIPGAHAPNPEAKYRALLEQIPAVVFMAYLDRGSSEAYVNPQIEASLGYSIEEWLEDPIRWYEHIHPDDKQRWSVDAAEMFLTGNPLRSAYRVIARDGKVIWFQCDARMKRSPDGRPWFVHGVAFDITDLKRIEEERRKEGNFISAILDTVGALVVVLDGEGRILRFNPACEITSGYSLEEVQGKCLWDLFLEPDEAERFKRVFELLRTDLLPQSHQTSWKTRHGELRLIAWTSSLLPDNGHTGSYVIATGIDITERKQLEEALLEISAREQRRIGQDLHDGLGQHLTGIAFMAKVHEARLAESKSAETEDAAKIVGLVNQAIHRTRELARGLLPVIAEAQGLMSALQVMAGEVEDLFGVSCRFESEAPVLVHDDTAATHLYRIAQEAVNNAIKHGDSREIVIQLTAVEGKGRLVIKDDGKGIPEGAGNSQGMGLNIMRYRSGMIGGVLEIRRESTRGTTIVCTFPLRQGE